RPLAAEIKRLSYFPSVTPRYSTPARSSSRLREHTYRPAWWIPGAHAQTLWGKFARRRSTPQTRLDRWTTPDGDFIDVLRLAAPPHRPRLFLLHGLEGTVRSHYVGGLLQMARQREWGADMLIFRGCGEEINRSPRFYHSGETSDLEFAI